MGEKGFKLQVFFVFVLVAYANSIAPVANKSSLYSNLCNMCAHSWQSNARSGEGGGVLPRKRNRFTREGRHADTPLLFFSFFLFFPFSLRAGGIWRCNRALVILSAKGVCGARVCSSHAKVNLD